MANELNICVRYDEGRPMVYGRELHEALGIKTKYKDWFPRMCAYGFLPGVDFTIETDQQIRDEGGRQVKREIKDHKMTVGMAKEICMIQRTEVGKQYRQYLLDIENKWNSPKETLRRAAVLNVNQTDELFDTIERSEQTIKSQYGQIKSLTRAMTIYTNTAQTESKRQIISDIIRMNSGSKAMMTARWLLAYRMFDKIFHMDSKHRLEKYNETAPRGQKCRNRVEYIEKIGKIEDFYNIVIKLYGTETDRLIETMYATIQGDLKI